MLLLVVMVVAVVVPTESTDARFSEHQAHAQPAGRLHRLLVPRIHLRSQSFALE